MTAPLCELSPDGYHESSELALNWRDRTVLAVRDVMNGASPLMAGIWPYRLGHHSYLVCDFYVEHTNRLFAITFCLGEEPNLTHLDEPTVPDFADALHLATMVINELGATARLGMRGTGQSPLPLSTAGTE
ncbi:hypothetical protein RAS12_30865 (plasmid) [Achromobacter seleniivolatilans]|uniref:Uncharacterized protein n=1 Tax=Achromobacter seleniivolatilans TaxID=3047478 RepID=A0ABY9MAI7_9BURK|nr:hypothetical protein [Achromobacter sp. R39]WMD24036.1 hypothetical protein RAS12_30865 [Achromobacter sp. R39]